MSKYPPTIALGKVTNGFAYSSRPDPVEPKDKGCCSLARVLADFRESAYPRFSRRFYSFAGFDRGSSRSCSCKRFSTASSTIFYFLLVMFSAQTGITDKLTMTRAPRSDRIFIGTLQMT